MESQRPENTEQAASMRLAQLEPAGEDTATLAWPIPVPRLTQLFFNVSPAGHPAVTPVLKLGDGGHDTDGLDVLSIGD